MKKQSAGLLVYRRRGSVVEVLIGHPGGPFWAKKDQGVWSIPKGEYENDEDPKKAAIREFEEEAGQPVSSAEMLELGTVEQKNNKTVIAWAVEGDMDTDKAQSNTFKMEWPPKSGKLQEFPELDKMGWFTLGEAAEKLNPDQVSFLDRLAKLLGVPFEDPNLISKNQASLF